MYGQGFIFTVTYADNSDFSDAQTIQKTLMLQSGVTEYSVFEELSIPLGSWVKIEESHSSYNQNISLSTLTYSTVYSLSQQTLISEYACGTPFRVNKTGNYTITLQNDAEFLDTLHFQKVWINSRHHTITEKGTSFSRLFSWAGSPYKRNRIKTNCRFFQRRCKNRPQYIGNAGYQQ